MHLPSIPKWTRQLLQWKPVTQKRIFKKTLNLVINKSMKMPRLHLSPKLLLRLLRKIQDHHPKVVIYHLVEKHIFVLLRAVALFSQSSSSWEATNPRHIQEWVSATTPRWKPELRETPSESFSREPENLLKGSWEINSTTKLTDQMLRKRESYSERKIWKKNERQK